MCSGKRRCLWPSGEMVKKGEERSGKRIIGEISCVYGWEHCVWWWFVGRVVVISIIYCPLWSFGERCAVE